MLHGSVEVRWMNSGGFIGPRNRFVCFTVTCCCCARPYCTFNETVADGAATPLDAVTVTA
jgi:hypothetical protein